jgi:hypothetical protein
VHRASRDGIGSIGSVRPALFVELVAGLLDLIEVFRCPDPYSAKGCAKAHAELRELVFNLWRHDRMHGPLDQAVSFHLAQGLREHFLASRRGASLTNKGSFP